MARLRKGGYLTCFYCGKRSTTRFNGALPSFDCANCEATNYLDENGDITDPPVATEQVAPRNAPRTTASGRSVGGLQAPPSSSSTVAAGSEPIFCETCLKNQRLFTASLAQYYSSDEPGDSESEGLDRRYYKFRRGLEERYPQVCNDCQGRVGEAIAKAGYTAKTDHLRKMMERSREARTVRKTTTILDCVSTVGRWLWWGGLILQLLWHARVLLEIQSRAEASGMSDPDEPKNNTLHLERLVDLFPAQDLLIRYSLIAAVVSLPWNPHLVQVVRGFSKHLLGIQQWYSYQVIIVAIRFAFRYLIDLHNGENKTAVVSAHLAIGGFMCLVYFQASRSIRVDPTPLFAPHESTISPKRDIPPTPKSKAGEVKSFSDVLNEALDSPSMNLPPSQETREQQDHQLNFTPRQTRQTPKPTFGGMSLSGTPARSDVGGGDEMDWTPTRQQEPQSLPRAFKESPSSPSRPFGGAPVQTDHGAFWYKVPPAPLNPAHRMRNPPNQPSLRARPVEKGENMFFRQGDKRHTQTDETQNGQVSFRQPKFFAKDKSNDEANSLADLLGQSFNMGLGEDEEELGGGQENTSTSPARKRGKSSAGSRRRLPAMEAGSLAAALIVWLLSLSSPLPYTVELQVGTLAVAGVVSLSLLRARRSVGASITAGEMAILGWIAQETWRQTSDVGLHGFSLLAGMFGHLVWDIMMTKTTAS